MSRVAVVQFDEFGKLYDFRTDIDGLESGDLLVVNTRNGFALAEFKNYKGHSETATKWVVQKVDLEAHNERLEKQAKIDSIKAKLKERQKKLEEIAIFKMLAEKDEEMAKLLEELKQLT